MSKILDLAKTFEQTSKQEAGGIEQEREERLSAFEEVYRGGISAKREEHQKRHPRSKQARQYGDIEAILGDVSENGK